VERDTAMCGWRTTHLCGTPITLSVPHHYTVTIIDNYYEKNGNVLRDSNDPEHKPLCTRDVSFAVEDTKEIFTVDFVKPGAGTLATSATLDPTSQYFTGIHNTIEDTTIQEITSSIKSLTSTLSPLRSVRSTASSDASVVPHPRVVAVIYVDVADPMAKEKIHEFLCHHLNECNGCCPAPVTENVTAPPAPLPMPTSTMSMPTPAATQGVRSFPPEPMRIPNAGQTLPPGPQSRP
jgi:hypothetical protein